MPIEIEVADTQVHLKVDPADVIRLVRDVLVEENRPAASISIAIVDDAAIHLLNFKHLGHDWPTDVITFPLSSPEEPTIAGELVVSAEMAVATALELRGDPYRELALYLIHGLLHLCGYDDTDDASSGAMTRRQDELLESLASSWCAGR